MTPAKQEVALAKDTAAIVENVIINGDLSQLSAPERIAYYHRVCESAGLNPLMKPFEYLKLNGKLVLYALRSATDQLRAIHGISVVEMTDAERYGLYAVTVKVQDKDGRTDMATGAVRIDGLAGDAAANAVMKAETKAKRRATLSLCGLGLLDETEVETIPGAQTEPLADLGETITDEQTQELGQLLTKHRIPIEKFLKVMRVGGIADIPASKFTEARNQIQEVIDNRARKAAEGKV